jgi:hypothetical protein
LLPRKNLISDLGLTTFLKTTLKAQWMGEVWVEMNALGATMHNIFDIVLLDFAREDTFVLT